MEHGSVTLTQLFEYFEVAALVEGSTKHKCRSAVRKLVEIFGNVPAESLMVPMIGQYQVSMRATSMSVASVRSYFAAAAEVFLWAVENKVLTWSPFAEAKKMRPVKRDVQTFGTDEVADLRQAAGDKWRKEPTARLRWFLMIEIAATGGLRAGELQNLRREDFDLDVGTLHVQYRPDKWGEYWEWGTKGKTDRIVPMSQDALEAAYRLFEVAKWRYPTLKQCTCERLQKRIGSIPELVRKQPYQDFYAELRGIRKLANERRAVNGLSAIKNGGIHRLRRTAVSDWAQQGVSMAHAQYVAGHQSMMTTRDYYIAVDHLAAVESVRSTINR